jgi:hypothetical protein
LLSSLVRFFTTESSIGHFMPGRRRDQRFTLSVPWEGALRVPSDVTIERYGADEVWVVSTTPAHRDEMLTLDAIGSGPSVTVNVRVTDSVPVLIDGVVRHRLRLAIVG